MKRRLAVITTRLPPLTCGIGAYSLLLRKHWPEAGETVTFLVVEGAASAEGVPRGDVVVNFNARPAELSRALDEMGAADVLLHYAGRAYHRFGCPLWMPGVIARWKQRHPGARLMVFFHEVPGALPITSRHFWLGKLNARIVRRLAALADVVATNTQNHSEQLRRITGRRGIQLLPVGSNIEQLDNAVASRNETEFALFGLPFGRLQTLNSLGEHMRSWLRSRRITRLHLIGPCDDQFAAEADKLIEGWFKPDIVERHGVLASAEVSRLLSRVGFALTNVTAETWSKSGAFMACAAHRCAVVVRDRPADMIPLSYAVAADEVEKISPAEIERRTDALAHWYQENADWPIVARKLAEAWDATPERS